MYKDGHYKAGQTDRKIDRQRDIDVSHEEIELCIRMAITKQERQTDRQIDRQTEGERETERNREKHVTRGNNIAVDRWTGASNPNTHPSPNLHTQACRPLVFPLFHLDRQTNIETGVEMRERMRCQDAQSSSWTF